MSALTLSAAVPGVAQLLGDLVTGRVAESSGYAFSTPYEDTDGAGKYQFLGEVLRWRAQTQPDTQLFTLLDNRVRDHTFIQYIYIYIYIHSVGCPTVLEISSSFLGS